MRPLDDKLGKWSVSEAQHLRDVCHVAHCRGGLVTLSKQRSTPGNTLPARLKRITCRARQTHTDSHPRHPRTR